MVHYATSQYDNCAPPFSKCLTINPYIGATINHGNTTVIDAFNEFGLGAIGTAGTGDNSLDKIVPFIVERKFGYLNIVFCLALLLLFYVCILFLITSSVL